MFEQFEALEGLPFAEVRRRFADAVIIGFLPPRGSAEALRVNPPEEELLPKGARIIGLAHNGARPSHPPCARVRVLAASAGAVGVVCAA